MTYHDEGEDRLLIEAEAKKVEAVEECRRHEGYFMTMSDSDAERTLYAHVTQMQKDKKFNGTLKQVIALTTSVLEDTGWDCAQCEREKAA
ncbi:MAG: hypothetical protein JSR47_11340 [Proteobacteria bacterium]|nr:hypothetical protein [Pseudomonadota bacterium]